MQDHHQVKPEPWARYKAKCAYFAPKLAELGDFFKEIAAGKHDGQSAYTEGGVASELEMIRDELEDLLRDEPRIVDDPADVL